MKKNCILTAVGKGSLHRNWTDADPGIDVHLIVYDDSYDAYKNDTPFITRSAGYKFNLIYDYLTKNKSFIEKYDYFYMPDDDILISPENVRKLFHHMKQYKLGLAQPAIEPLHWTFRHTVRTPGTILRHTNFVEIMQPCFSRSALKKVLWTFKESVSGWGIDYHWGELLNFHKGNIAVIDDIYSIHTRPLQSAHHDEKKSYLSRHKLEGKIFSE